MITIADIRAAVAAAYGLRPDDLRGRGRAGLVCEARHLAFYLAVEHCPNASLRAIGLQFGGRDHSTVRHGIDRIREILPQNPALQARLEAVIEALHRRLTEAAPGCSA